MGRQMRLRSVVIFEKKLFRTVDKGFVFLTDDVFRRVFYLKRNLKHLLEFYPVFEDGSVSRQTVVVHINFDFISCVNSRVLGIFEINWVDHLPSE